LKTKPDITKLSQDAEALGEIDLTLALARSIEEQFEGKDFCFELLVLGKTLVLSAETSKDKAEWLELLHCIHDTYNLKKVVSSDSNYSLSSLASSSGSTTSSKSVIRPLVRSQLSTMSMQALTKLMGVFSSKIPEKEFAQVLLFLTSCIENYIYLPSK